MTATRVPPDLQTVFVPVEKVHANPWNPNKMDERTYQAERESIRLYGFIDPLTVRPHPELEGEYEIVDGEHRHRAAQDESIEAVPVIVLDLDDAAAKKLTVILNETRGNADVVLLGQLLADLEQQVGDQDELLRGLAYSETELQHYLALGREDWDQFRSSGDPDPPPRELDTKLLVVELPATVHEQVTSWLEIIQRELGFVSDAEAIVEATRRVAHELNQSPAPQA